MHESLLLVLALVSIILMVVMLGEKLRISYPIFLVIAGLALSFIPGIPSRVTSILEGESLVNDASS